MLGPSPIAKQEQQHQQRQHRFNDFLILIKHDMQESDLWKFFEVVVTKMGQKGRDSSPIVPPTPSSAPTGAKWTLNALADGAKALLHFNSTNTGALEDFFTLSFRDQYTLLAATVERLLSKNSPTNDRRNTFENVMNILGRLGPEQSDLMAVVTQPLIEMYHTDIPKPFVNYVGQQFRSADGSNNSPLYPSVGKAGNNYVRSVTSTSRNNPNLPSPKDVFHKLLKRPDGVFEEHKGGINMLLFYLAIIITHDLFYTDPSDPMRNLTTSYLDMSSLYGYSRADQESVRQMDLGLLKPDQWFDKRLVIQPAGVASLMVMFSRNHNFIAKKLLEINENERFSYGPGKRLKTKQEQDEKLFQTARLVNNGCYVNIIIHDYIRTINGTAADSDFFLDPFATPSNPTDGNAVSIEFNAIYRWHAAIGKEDSEWLTEVMNLLMAKMQATRKEERYPGLDSSLINKGVQSDSIFDQLLKGFNEHFVKATPEELARGLPIAGAHRAEDGAFADTDILRALRNGYKQRASELGNGLNTPAALEHVEIAGINQARILDTCYFNDFRKFLRLTTLDTFEDFSEKKEVQDALKELYGHPDKVELYAGLMIERVKPTGLRLPYTMGRAILSDAVNLLRNDRILSKELTPANLTNWGYDYTLGDPQANNRIFPTMLSNLFPNGSTEAFTMEELRTLFQTPEFNKQ